jgi:predicted anti-sigma-YlaC factor YlaD
VRMDRCANCGLEVPPTESGRERQPCPRCGAVEHIVELSATVAAGATVSAGLSVERGVNEARMGAFALIFATSLGIGLSVGLATSSVLLGSLAGLGAGVLTTLVVASIYRVRFVRQAVMTFMHRVTGQ